MVGSIDCGAAVSVESGQRLAEYCVLVHRRLRLRYPDLRLVLLTHEGTEAPDGVVVRDFLRDRMTLLQEAFLVTTPDRATGVAMALFPPSSSSADPTSTARPRSSSRSPDSDSPPSPHRRSTNWPD
ncbi:hypothetical protein AB0I54_06800 [Streptomyces sp. NPDC050625]|uniref:hypothetical protein n=1 Tax=Streptomyces sp. NPDC050625 TaxID=3154629 RepID=UPI00341E03F1